MSNKGKVGGEVDQFVNTVICGNCADIMSQFPDDFIDLTVTSPPY